MRSVRLRRPRSVALLVALVLLVASAVASAAVRDRQVAAGPRAGAAPVTYPVPVPVHVDGAIYATILFYGTLHGAKIGDQVCLWIGTGPFRTPVALSDGARASLDPLRVVSTEGVVVGREGDLVDNGGGPSGTGSGPCTAAGKGHEGYTGVRVVAPAWVAGDVAYPAPSVQEGADRYDRRDSLYATGQVFSGTMGGEVTNGQVCLWVDTDGTTEGRRALLLRPGLRVAVDPVRVVGEQGAVLWLHGTPRDVTPETVAVPPACSSAVPSGLTVSLLEPLELLGG